MKYHVSSSDETLSIIGSSNASQIKVLTLYFLLVHFILKSALDSMVAASSIRNEAYLVVVVNLAALKSFVARC